MGYVIFEAKDAAGPDKYDFGWKKTTDDGATWDAAWTWVNWWNADLDGGGKLGDLVQALNYEIDFIVQGEANPFFVGTFVDTVDGTNTGIYVVANQGAGWKAWKIAKVNATSQALAGGLSTLNECEFARSEDGSILAVKFADYPTETATGYDLFVSWFDGAAWTAVENVTQTEATNEYYSQTAPRLYATGTTDEWQLLSMYTQFGLDGTTGEPSDLAECDFYFLDGVTAVVTPATGVGDDNLNVNTFSLSQNYPNPFNPSTSISYTLAADQFVSLKVYDVLGREVATLVNQVMNAGSHKVSFNASSLSTGLYFYTINAGDFTSTKKMMLIK
jgi:hypothetical protein